VQVDIDTRKRDAGRTALVADDNAAIRQMIVSAFQSNGFKTIVEAENGREAVELAKEVQPDIITLDLSMPVMNGLEAAAEVHKIIPKTPIILFTLYGDGLSQTEAAKAGISLVLAKTTPLSMLLRMANRLLGVPD
jgi:two-component system chemotaxis response regulator CheY